MRSAEANSVRSKTGRFCRDSARPAAAEQQQHEVDAVLGGEVDLIRGDIRDAGVVAVSGGASRASSARTAASAPGTDGIRLSRAAGSATFPCRAQLVLAANPCPCASAAGDAA